MSVVQDVVDLIYQNTFNGKRFNKGFPRGGMIEVTRQEVESTIGYLDFQKAKTKLNHNKTTYKHVQLITHRRMNGEGKVESVWKPAEMVPSETIAYGEKRMKRTFNNLSDRSQANILAVASVTNAIERLQLAQSVNNKNAEHLVAIQKIM